MPCIQPYVDKYLTNGFPLQQGVDIHAGNDECHSLLVDIVLSPDDGFSRVESLFPFSCLSDICDSHDG